MIEVPGPARRRRNPWWIPLPILGRVPPTVSDGMLAVLGFVSFALFFENYDISLLGNALKYIAEDLGIPESGFGDFMTLIRLGALPAFFVIPFVDRLGRRRLFLFGLLGMSIGTLSTAFAQNVAQFVACQMVTRTFVLTASAVSIVIVAEELPASARGWGIGMLGAVSAVGHGLGALVFSAIESLPWGWRSLYAFGVLPLLLLPVFRRGIRETGRFTAHRARQGEQGDQPFGLRAWWAPIREFVGRHPARTAGMAVVASVSSAGHAVAAAFIGYVVLKYRGWTPGELTTMVVGAGLIGIVGNVVAGHFADRLGRRTIGFTFLAVFPPLAWLFYQGPGGWLVPVFWTALVFTMMGASVIIRALSSELFPTGHRGTSTGILALMETLGAACGLALLGYLQQRGGQLIELVPMISLGALAAGFVLLLLPETSRRELETISEDAA